MVVVVWGCRGRVGSTTRPSGAVNQHVPERSRRSRQPGLWIKRVVRLAQQHQVVDLGGPAVLPVHDVVGLEVEAAPAAWEPARAIAREQGPLLGRGGEPGGRGDRDRLAVAFGDHGDPRLTHELGDRRHLDVTPALDRAAVAVGVDVHHDMEPLGQDAVAAHPAAQHRLGPPEVHHTPIGRCILENFALKVCSVKPEWTPANIISDSVAAIQAQVGAGRVLAAVSGGVDSSVMAALVYKAIGGQLVSVFVDNGLLRSGERESVSAAMRAQIGDAFHTVDAVSDSWVPDGVTDPERKRRAIGKNFIEVFEAQAKNWARWIFSRRAPFIRT